MPLPEPGPPAETEQICLMVIFLHLLKIWLTNDENNGGFSLFERGQIDVFPFDWRSLKELCNLTSLKILAKFRDTKTYHC